MSYVLLSPDVGLGVFDASERRSFDSTLGSRKIRLDGSNSLRLVALACGVLGTQQPVNNDGMVVQYSGE